MSYEKIIRTYVIYSFNVILRSSIILKYLKKESVSLLVFFYSLSDPKLMFHDDVIDCIAIRIKREAIKESTIP